MIQTLNIPDDFKVGSFTPNIIVGDTIYKLSFSALPTDNIDFTTCTIRMQVYNQGGVKLLDLSNGNGITVIDSKNFEIDEITFANNPFIYEGIYNGDLEITDVNGRRKTYNRVKYTVLKQYTI